jgi:hypothetical protein
MSNTAKGGAGFGRVFPVVRTVIIVIAVCLFLWWVTGRLRSLDLRLGTELPAWVRIPGIPARRPLADLIAIDPIAGAAPCRPASMPSRFARTLLR